MQVQQPSENRTAVSSLEDPVGRELVSLASLFLFPWEKPESQRTKKFFNIVPENRPQRWIENGGLQNAKPRKEVIFLLSLISKQTKQSS